ncbi:hypothetical protein [Pseudomonas gorinensis]
MTWYKTGTASVTSGSNAVIGTGTSFIANSRVGDAFRGPDGEWYEVTNIASDTALSIAPNYQGATVAAGVYSLAPMQGYVKDSADALRAATQVIASGVADMQDQVAAATEAATSAGQSKTVATEQAGIASAAADASAGNKDASQLAAQQSGLSAQASAAAADRAETAKTSIIQSEQAAAASASAAAASAEHAEEVTLGKAASGENNDITSLRALSADGFDRLRQGIAPMVGATATVAGTKGLVPVASVAERLKVLSGAGVWVPLPTGAAWGAITGTLSAQTDLQLALDAKQSVSTAPFTKFFESAPTAWTVAGQLTFTHGLGALPKYVEIEVIVTAAFASTPVGTRFSAVLIYASGYLGAQVDGRTATTVTVRCGNTMIRLINTTSGDQGTPANTQIIVRAAA